MKPKLQPKGTPALNVIMTEHAVLRMRERMPDDFTFPTIGSYVRLLTMQDTYHDLNLELLRLKGGIVIGKWNGSHLAVVTMFSEKTFHRFQKRQKSRFQPLNTTCYLLNNIIFPKAA
jgi:hypothetical protein